MLAHLSFQRFVTLLIIFSIILFVLSSDRSILSEVSKLRSIGDDGSTGTDGITVVGRMMTHAAQKRRERDAWFHSALSYESDNIAGLPLHSFIGGTMIQPSSFCPADLVKTTSVSEVFDGGKWLCGASRLKALAQLGRSCSVYSLGCNFETSFEETIQNMTGHRCDIHMYDPTMKPPEKVHSFKEKMAKKRIYLHEVAVKGVRGHSNISIENQTYRATGLKNIIQENNHDCIDILKFDIEGAEYAILEEMPWNQLCIGMVLFELHGSIIGEARGGQTYTVGDAIRHIRRLEDAGFHHYNTEQVCFACDGQVELAFVNITWLATNPGEPKVPLPT